METDYKLSHKTKKRIKEVKRKARPGKFIHEKFQYFVEMHVCFTLQLTYYM